MSEPSNSVLSVTPEQINAILSDAFPGSRNECVELTPRTAIARITPDASALRPGGYISGPTQFGLADATLWYLTFAAIDRIEPMALTSELSIRYLRPAVGTTLWARAELNSVGRRSIVGSVTIWTDDNAAKPSSVAQGTYVLPREPS